MCGNGRQARKFGVLYWKHRNREQAFRPRKACPEGGRPHDCQRKPAHGHPGILFRMADEPPAGGICSGSEPGESAPLQPRTAGSAGRRLHRILDEGSRPDSAEARRNLGHGLPVLFSVHADALRAGSGAEPAAESRFDADVPAAWRSAGPRAGGVAVRSGRFHGSDGYCVSPALL